MSVSIVLAIVTMTSPPVSHRIVVATSFVSTMVIISIITVFVVSVVLITLIASATSFRVKVYKNENDIMIII